MKFKQINNMKYIVIKTAEVTDTLRNYSDSNVSMTVLRIPVENIEDADTELLTIEDENWVSSDTYTETDGNTTEGILLPKKAINA